MLQALNYLIPIITMPYLIRVLGIEKYGIITFAYSIISYFIVLTDYGFNLTATRYIAIYKGNQEKINEVVGSVYIIKFIIFIISFLFLVAIVQLFPSLHQNKTIYYLYFGVVLGQVLFPVWFFQGMESMKYITIVNTISKTILCLAIFLFVRQSVDMFLVPIFYSLGYLIAGIYSVVVIISRFNVTLRLQKKEIIIYYFRDGWSIFLSRVFGALYRNSNIVILGIVSGPESVAYYAVAEKVIKVFQSLQDVFGNSIYPYLSKIYTNNNLKSYFIIVKKWLKPIALIYSMIVVIVVFFAKVFTILIMGGMQINVITNLRICSLVILIGGLNYILGILGLVALGYQKEFSSATIIIGIINIPLCFLLVSLFKDYGAAIAFVASESLLLLLIYKRIRILRISHEN